MEHFNGPQTKFISDSLYKHPVNAGFSLAGGLIKQTTAASDWSVRLQCTDRSQGVVAAFNQEKALVGAFFVITNLRMDFRFKL